MCMKRDFLFIQPHLKHMLKQIVAGWMANMILQNIVLLIISHLCILLFKYRIHETSNKIYTCRHCS
jgi:hypothetical protein